MKANTLVIYQTSGGRVVHYAEQSYGMPVIGDYDSTALWEPGTMSYQVGVNVYDPEDFDPATDLLTDTACAKWGIETSEKANYIKDLEISLPLLETGQERIDDFVVSILGGLIESITADPLGVALRPSYLQVTVEASTGMSARTAETGTGLQVFDPVLPENEGSFGDQKLTVLVKKIYEDDSEADEDTDQIMLRVSGGWILNPYIQSLVDGQATFTWQPAPGQSKQTATAIPVGNVYAPGAECVPGSKDIVTGCVIL